MATQEQQDTPRGNPEDADGIIEYDNDLPRWWIGLFIVCVIWGIWTMLDWHVFNERSLSSQYEARAATFVVPEPPDIEGVVALIASGEMNIEAGEATFQMYCAVCHKPDASGDIGPSLIDADWLYDHHVDGIVESIALGRPNGMAAWYDSLGKERVAEVAAWVASLTDAPFAEVADEAGADPDPETAELDPADDSTAGEDTVDDAQEVEVPSTESNP